MSIFAGADTDIARKQLSSLPTAVLQKPAAFGALPRQNASRWRTSRQLIHPGRSGLFQKTPVRVGDTTTPNRFPI